MYLYWTYWLYVSTNVDYYFLHLSTLAQGFSIPNYSEQKEEKARCRFLFIPLFLNARVHTALLHCLYSLHYLYHCVTPTCRYLLVCSLLCSFTCCDCSHSSTNCTFLLRQWTGVRTVCDGACVMCDDSPLDLCSPALNYCISPSTLSEHYLLLCLLSAGVGFHLKTARTGPSLLQPFWSHWWVTMGQLEPVEPVTASHSQLQPVRASRASYSQSQPVTASYSQLQPVEPVTASIVHIIRMYLQFVYVSVAFVHVHVCVLTVHSTHMEYLNILQTVLSATFFTAASCFCICTLCTCNT